MDIWRSAAGALQIEITSADNTALLQSLTDHGITMYDVSEIDSLTVCIGIDRTHFTAAQQIIKKQGGKWKVIDTLGLFWRLKALLRRPVLLFGGVLLLLCVLFLPSRIFFINVEGNLNIPEKLILEKAEECGIRFGVSRRTIRSESVKNALLSSITDLQWAGVNTSGCVATIHVREKSVLEEAADTSGTVGSIVASRDGVIVSTTVINGNLLCKTGEAVKAGQTLVSGYTDCGIAIQATCAEGEILAQTNRSLQAITLLMKQSRGTQTASKVRYGLLVGKKLIKFYKDSGISDATCVKMYSKEYLTLPGGFTLPVALVKEELLFYETADDLSENMDWLQDVSREYLLKQMAAGQILNASTAIKTDGDVCVLSGEYACLEMIGQVKYEELMYDYGEEH